MSITLVWIADMVEYPCFETPGVGALNEDLLVAGDGSAWHSGNQIKSCAAVHVVYLFTCFRFRTRLKLLEYLEPGRL